MAYIVGLTIVMQNLFWISEPWKGQPITQEQATQALDIYQNSPLMAEVHDRIRDYASDKGVFETIAKEDVVSEIISLLDTFTGDPNIE